MKHEIIQGLMFGAVGAASGLFVRYYALPKDKKGVSAWRIIFWAVLFGIVFGLVFGLAGALLIRLTR